MDKENQVGTPPHTHTQEVYLWNLRQGQCPATLESLRDLLQPPRRAAHPGLSALGGAECR